MKRPMSALDHSLHRRSRIEVVGSLLGSESDRQSSGDRTSRRANRRRTALQQNDLLFGRALEARRKVTGRATDWIVVRNRLESVESSNQRQITRILDVIRTTLGFRIARGLLERPVYREFFAAGLTVFDQVEGFDSNAESSQPNLLARLDVQNLIREIGLIEEADLAWANEIEPKMGELNAEANDMATDKEDLLERTQIRRLSNG